MKVIIPCGASHRWTGLDGTPRHLIRLAGEQILHRTVRLVNEITDVQPSLVVDDTSDDRYKIKGSRRVLAQRDATRGQADKFMSSRRLWATDDRTIILFGDVWYSTDAITQILNSDTEDGWWVFYRFTKSAITGAGGGEIFGFVIDPDAHEAFDAALERIIELKRAGTIPRNNEWELYRALMGAENVRQHIDYGHRTIIDDFTEDFDGGADWTGWCWNYNRADPKPR